MPHSSGARVNRRCLQLVLRLLAANAEHYLARHLNAYLDDDDEYRAITRETIIRGLAGTIAYPEGNIHEIKAQSNPTNITKGGKLNAEVGLLVSEKTYTRLRAGQPGQQARSQQRRLARPRRSDQDQRERVLFVGQFGQQVRDIFAAEEPPCVLALEPGQPSVRSVGADGPAAGRPLGPLQGTRPPG